MGTSSIKETMKILILSKGQKTIMDDEDFEKYKDFTWYLNNKGYAVTEKRINKKKNSFLLHRVIMKAAKGEFIDHINRDKLDNRKSNLRFVTVQQNNINMSLLKTNSSGFKGVCYRSDRKKYVAGIYFNNKRLHLGLFTDKEDAALAYNEAAKKLFGEFAYLNKL